MGYPSQQEHRLAKAPGESDFYLVLSSYSLQVLLLSGFQPLKAYRVIHRKESCYECI
jgi:hypothetical protein